MDSNDIRRGCDTTLQVAHKLLADLGRLPTPHEIQWRLATHFQVRNPERGGRALKRSEAMELAQQMMNMVSAVTEYNTTTNGDPNGS